MFKVIRIPTKFSRTIKRFTEKEKSELLGILINIGDGKSINVPDTIVGDTISLIYGEWMNMESKNGNKPEESLIQYSSEGVAKHYPSESEHRVEYSRVEESKLKESKVNKKVLSKDNKQSSEEPRRTQKNPGEPKKSERLKNNPEKPYNDNDNNSDSNNDNNINNNSKELGTDVQSYGNEDINNIIEIIKTELKSLGLIYKPGKYERNRAQNILTSKAFGDVCNDSSMTREEFVQNIIRLSGKLEFWNGKIYNAETFYKHYAQVYNEARRIKSNKTTSKITTY